MKNNQDNQAAKVYAKPTLERRARLSEASEGPGPVLNVSGIILNGN